VIEVPGIAAGLEQQRLRGAEQAEFRRVALAEHDEARLLVGSDERIGFLRDVFRKETRAGGRARALEVVEILHEVRHACEGTFGEVSLRRFAGALVELRHDRVHLAVHLLDAADARFDKLKRRHLAVPHQFGLRQRIHLREFGGRQRRAEARTIGAGRERGRRRRFQERPPGKLNAHHHCLLLPALRRAILLTEAS
jgi:hypothetical protein